MRKKEATAVLLLAFLSGCASSGAAHSDVRLSTTEDLGSIAARDLAGARARRATEMDEELDSLISVVIDDVEARGEETLISSRDWSLWNPSGEPVLQEQEQETAEAGGGSLAEQATDPGAILMQFRIQDTFTPHTHAASGAANNVTIQPVLPIKTGDSFPDIIIRPTIPALVTTANPDGPQDRVTGLGDISVINLFKFDQSWGSWGIGPAFSLPTATDDFLGSEKLEVGPTAFVIYGGIPKVQIGALGWNFTSIAGDGDREDVNRLFIQPILNFHLDDGWYTGLSDLTVVRNWKTGGWLIPISWRVGRVTEWGSQPVNMSIAPFYNIVHKESGPSWGVKLSLTLLFP